MWTGYRRSQYVSLRHLDLDRRGLAVEPGVRATCLTRPKNSADQRTSFRRSDLLLC